MINIEHNEVKQQNNIIRSRTHTIRDDVGFIFATNLIESSFFPLVIVYWWLSGDSCCPR